MTTISIVEKAGAFAENKDIAREIRLKEIIPALRNGEQITLDFTGVNAATQSFIHALISDALRTFGGEALDKIISKACAEPVKKIINIVADYMQEGLTERPQ